MYGLQQYIEYNLPQGAIFSKVIYTPSALLAGVATVKKDYTQVGALWIIVQILILTFPAVVAANVTFSNEYGQTIFVMKNDPASNGIYFFPYIIEKGALLITSDNADINFSVGHQYITVEEKNRN